MLVTSTRNLVQAGRAAGLNTATFDYLANAILRQAGEKAVQKISRTAQELIVTELVAKLQAAGQLPYFAALAAKPGFIKAMTSLLSQFGRSGVTVDEVTEAFKYWEHRDASHQEKDVEVARLYTAYRKYLQQHQLFDVEGLYRLAVAAVQKPGFTMPWEHLYFYGFYAYDTLQLEIIQALSKRASVKVALVYEPDRPRVFAATENTLAALTGFLDQDTRITWQPRQVTRTAPLSYLTANLRRSGAGRYQDQTAKAVTDVQLWESLDSVDEQAQVLRQIKGLLQKGVPGKEIAILVRSLDKYTGFRRLCDAYGIPTVLPQVTALHTTPLAEYVLAFLRLGQGYGRDQAVAVQDFLCLPLQESLQGLQLAPLIEQSRLHYAQQAEEAWRLAQQIQPAAAETLVKLQAQAAAVPEHATLAAYSELLVKLLQDLQVQVKAGALYRSGQINLEAFKSLALAEAALAELGQELTEDARSSNLAARPVTRAEFLQLLQEKARTRSLILDSGSTEGITILAATAAEGLHFPYVYVLGLREHEFPSLQTENWIYDDGERGALRSLGIDVPGSQEGYAEDALFFATACAAATQNLVCTYAPDEQEGASPYVDDLVVLFGPELKKVRTGAVTAGEVASLAEYKHFCAEQGQTAALTPYVTPGFLAAAAVDKDRLATPADCPWNGTLTEQFLLPQVQQKIGTYFSASKLESYLACPFQFLYSYVWGQGEANEAVENIRPDVQGSLLHATLEKFIGAHLGQRLAQTNQETLLQELDADFTACCENFIRQGQIVAADFWAADQLQVQRILHRWLRSELAYSADWQYRPAAVEANFGGSGQALAIQLPAKTIFLNGRIDRLEQEGHQYFITDYKTSTAPAAKEFLHSNLQLPLYMWAAETYLRRLDPDAQVTGGGYFVLKQAERKASVAYAGLAYQFPFSVKTDLDGEPLTALSLLQEKLVQVLDQEITAMDAGHFQPLPGSQCSSFCPAWDVCRLALLKKAAGEDEDA
jgi:ATP-dependent helicase/DNAse subunit B